MIPYPPEDPRYATNILSIPGKVEHSRVVDDQGNIIETTKQTGGFAGPADQGGSYESNYLYKSEVKEEGEGTHKVTTQVTEVRTHQTVNWISKSRVLENDPNQEQSIRAESPKKIEEEKK